MGYSAQVQQSPNQQNSTSQNSGKGGSIGRFYEQAQQNATNNQQPLAQPYPPNQAEPQSFLPDQPLPTGMSPMNAHGINSGAPRQAMGKGGNYSMSATSGQPQAGAPNQYSNTVGMRDNMQQQRPQMGGGKGKA